VFAFVLLALLMLSGEHQLKPEVGEVLPDMPAHGVLAKGDMLREADGHALITWDDFQTYVSAHAGKPMTLVFERNGLARTATLTPEEKQFKDLLGDTHTVGRVGVAASYASFVQHRSPAAALLRAFDRTWEITSLTVRAVGKLLIGATSAENFTGPLGIADMAGQTAASGLYAVAMLTAVISINLMVVNLFPLPILDGGHLLFLAYEKLRGRPLPGRVQEWALKMGLALIIMLAAFATFNDVKRFGWLPHGAEATDAAAPASTQP
jgi:regulator of sigma E protease